MPTIPQPPSAAPTWNFSPAILAAWLAGFLPLESAPIWIPAAQIHYGVGAVATGIVGSMQFVVAALAATFIAPRLARRPLRRPLLAAMTVILLAAAGTALLHPSFTGFVLLRVADAAGAGICIASGAMLASRTPKPSRSFGAMQFGQIIANMIVYALSTKLVVAYGLSGLYGMLVAGMGVCTAIMFFGRGWPAAFLERPRRDVAAAPQSLRIIIGCISVAIVYCGFIALMANANALGGRAGIDFAHVTMVLAITTPAGALGALIAILLAGRVPGAFMISASAIGTAGFGLFLVFGGLTFNLLTAALCGVIMSIYIGIPSIYSGIAALDVTGRSAALTQATQFLGPVLGPAAGAMIAVHSVTAFAATSGMLVTGGILLGGAAVWPRVGRDVTPAASETGGDVRRLRRVA
jgi:hypothetical protein